MHAHAGGGRQAGTRRLHGPSAAVRGKTTVTATVLAAGSRPLCFCAPWLPREPVRTTDRALVATDGGGGSRELGDESPGARSTVVGVQTVEEFPDRPPRSEHVKGHMLPMLRNDLVFALRF